MTRLFLTALALGAALSAPAMAQTDQTPAPAPAESATPVMPTGPSGIIPAGKTGCSRDRAVMS